MLSELKNAGVRNKESRDMNFPETLKIVIKPSQNVKMLYPKRNITYKLHEYIKGEYKTSSMVYSGNFMYFKPKVKTDYYGFIQYDNYFPQSDLLVSITGIDNQYKMSEANFNSIYKAFNTDYSNGTKRYFTEVDYTYFFEVIPQLISGNETDIKKTAPDKVAVVPGKTEENNGEIFRIVDVPPQYPGGNNELAKWMAANLKYPEEARKNRIQGTVYVAFVVNINGSLSDIKVANAEGLGLDEEALRLIQICPSWIPGKLEGKLVRVRMILPVNFELKD